MTTFAELVSEPDATLSTNAQSGTIEGAPMQNPIMKTVHGQLASHAREHHCGLVEVPFDAVRIEDLITLSKSTVGLADIPHPDDIAMEIDVHEWIVARIEEAGVPTLIDLIFRKAEEMAVEIAEEMRAEDGR